MKYAGVHPKLVKTFGNYLVYSKIQVVRDVFQALGTNMKILIPCFGIKDHLFSSLLLSDILSLRVEKLEDYL